MMVLGKKELIGGTIIAVIFFVVMGFCLKLNNKVVYYQVIFDSDGGTEVAGQNILVNGQVGIPIDTIREGYIFKGWYLNDKKFDFDTKINKDITLIARWEKVVKDKDSDKSKDDIVVEVKNDDKNNIEKKKEDNNNNSQVQVPGVSNSKPVVIDVSSITLNRSSVSLKVGESSSIVATVLPGNATNKTITWNTSNSAVVVVSNGNISAVGAGTAVISATTANGKSATCTVTVTKNVTYHYEIIDTPDSSIGQCDIYLKNSDGVSVSGTLIIHYTNGKDETVYVTASGVRRIRSAISSVSIANVG